MATTQQEDYQQGMQLLADATAVLEGVAHENRSTLEQAVAGANTSVTNAVASIAKNSHKYFVDPSASQLVADGSADNPFKYVRDALLVAPYGGVVEIEVPDNVDFYFSDPESETYRNTNWYGVLFTIRTKTKSVTEKSSMKFASVSNNSTTLISSLSLSASMLLQGINIDSGLLLEGTTSSSTCIKSLGNLKIVLEKSSLEVGSNYILGSHINGLVEMSLHDVDIVKKDGAESTVIFNQSVSGKINVYANNVSVAGLVADYFNYTVRESVSWNDAAIEGTQ